LCSSSPRVRCPNCGRYWVLEGMVAHEVDGRGRRTGVFRVLRPLNGGSWFTCVCGYAIRLF